MNNRTVYCFALVLLLRAIVPSQTLVAIPDTSAYRGSILIMPVNIALVAHREDTIKITVLYLRSALYIEQVVPEFPTKFRVFRLVSDQALTVDSGQAEIEAVAAESLVGAELRIVCTVLWSGTSPAFVRVRRIEINRVPVVLESRGGRIQLLPDQVLPITEKVALGPLSPQPLYDRRLSITYWLTEVGAPTFVLYDPSGREYGRWNMQPQSAGSHTFEIELDRMATAAGIYYLRMQVGQHTLIAPCVIAK